ncbi:MAG: bifunctional acetaldehyde-CoA/alcohol dehydrogenase [Candidatus Melainabacteria bacterium]|nr:bifunctional acetaldehyde-CoA/alcohol dehydrogenase [Candidatus Melainabacteria bacterium]
MTMVFSPQDKHENFVLDTEATRLNFDFISELQEDSFPHVDQLLLKARKASAVFTQYTQGQVDKIVYAVVRAALEHSREFAKLAVEETRMGLFEDKILKNIVASEFLYHQIKDKKTVNVIREIKDEQMVEIAEPVGVIAALTPVTNPTSTVIYKSIISLKTRNAIVFSPHLMSSKCVAYTAEVLYKAALKAGAPEGCIGWLKRNSKLRKQTNYLIHHKEVDLVFATGGTTMVKVAYSSGKPAIGVGSGNTPVYVHKSYDVSSAAMDICISKTFDNGNECPSEQTLVVDDDIYEQLLQEFKKINCYICKEEETKKLTPVVIDPETGVMNYKYVGKEAYKIAQAAGIDVPTNTKILLCEINSDDKNHPLLKEKLMPVLAVLRAESEGDALSKCLLVNHSGGTGHTAGIFAKDENVIAKFQNLINAGRIIVNQPTSLGGLGGMYNNLPTTLSFGCGTGGANSTTENVNIYNLLNIKRVPRRQIMPMWFRIPNQVYFNPGSLNVLKIFPAKNAFIVTDKTMEKLGVLKKVIDNLPNGCNFKVFSDVESEPSKDVIDRGLTEVSNFSPDYFIAVGGGSVIDATKGIRLFYECPDIKFEDLSVDFVDFRKRVISFPTLGKTKLVAIPTTSGTGSEVSPACVIADKKNNLKVSLFDYNLTPDIAIIDSELVCELPVKPSADTGIDAFTHALEAFVSIYANDFTDALCLQAIKIIYETLPKVIQRPHDVEIRQKMHNAATLAGMAFSNASVGINHAMAHALGAKFGVPHGRANAVFLLSTIDFNSGIPTKFMPFPNNKKYIAKEKYAEIAKSLGSQNNEIEKLIVDLKEKIKELLSKSGLPCRISELDIKLDDYLAAIPDLVSKAFNDLSLRTNPRMPLVEELEGLFRNAY